MDKSRHLQSKVLEFQSPFNFLSIVQSCRPPCAVPSGVQRTATLTLPSAGSAGRFREQVHTAHSPLSSPFHQQCKYSVDKNNTTGIACVLRICQCPLRIVLPFTGCCDLIHHPPLLSNKPDFKEGANNYSSVSFLTVNCPFQTVTRREVLRGLCTHAEALQQPGLSPGQC